MLCAACIEGKTIGLYSVRNRGIRGDNFKPQGGGDATRWAMSSLTCNPLETSEDRDAYGGARRSGR